MNLIARRAIGAGLVAAGVVLCLSAVAIGARKIAWQSLHESAFRGRPDPLDPAPATPAGVAELGAAPAPAACDPREDAIVPAAPDRGSAIARLRVPRVGIDVIVAEGTDAATLRLGPGHLEGSALPGASDNCVIAGHRDGPFRRLGDLRIGDRVDLSGEAAGGAYRVESIDVVDRSDSDPLAPTDRAVLTLITCYPFNHVGSAPRRLIVRAALSGGPTVGSP